MAARLICCAAPAGGKAVRHQSIKSSRDRDGRIVVDRDGGVVLGSMVGEPAKERRADHAGGIADSRIRRIARLSDRLLDAANLADIFTRSADGFGRGAN
jgi:hypothetical protein